MRMTEIDFDGRKPIDSYGPGFFRIEGALIEGPVLMTADGAIRWAGLDDTSAVLKNLADMDVVFFGMGAEIAHLPRDIAAALKEAGIAFEIMGTPAACRTYNVLLSEGRQVGAALLPA